MRKLFPGLLVAHLIVFLAGVPAWSDWQTYRGNNRRSGVTSESLPKELKLHWIRQARHAPCTAWSKYDNRMFFDLVYHTVISENTVLFGSSSDDKVYALDAVTGGEKWTFFTSGPVRFAPVVDNGRVFVTSDDGYLYCLNMVDGSCIWKFRGGPTASMVLGNERMISRWPVRVGPLVADGVVYFAAGIWPTEDVFIYALDAVTGKVIWVNDACGYVLTEQPHKNNRARSGVSAQGYLATDGKRLFVPTGRSVPAVFSLADGKLLYFQIGYSANQRTGGADVVVDTERSADQEPLFYNNGRVYLVKDGKPFRWLQNQTPTMSVPACFPNTTVPLPNGVCFWDREKVRGWHWYKVTRKDRQGNEHIINDLDEVWSSGLPYGGTSLIVAGGCVISGGGLDGNHGVSMMDLDTRETIWSAEVDSAAYGLAVARQHLYVSTTSGAIYCFGPAGEQIQSETIKSPTEPAVFPDQELYIRAAEEIIQKTGCEKGFCVDLGCGEGALTYALARRTQLHIIAIESDAKKVAIARRKLDAEGLYGSRVSVIQGDPKLSELPSGFANLVVSGRSVAAGSDTGQLPSAEAKRLCRPWGGMAVLGSPGAMQDYRRGPLPNTGSWTHQYADAANLLSNDERSLHSPLVMRWFTDFKYRIANRHGRIPVPLFKNGIMVIVGLNGILAFDAYNGSRIWQYDIKGITELYNRDEGFGTSATGSLLCIADDSVYVRTDNYCLRLDLNTGEKLQQYSMPVGPEGQSGTWGFIACVDGTLFGSRYDENYILMDQHGKYLNRMDGLCSESNLFFAIDVDTGKTKWTYKPRYSIRINAIAIGDGFVYLIDRPVAEADVFKVKSGPKPVGHPTGVLMALKADNGDCKWSTDEDIYGTTLVLSEKYNVLLMSYQLDQRDACQRSELGKRLSGFNAENGNRLWDAEHKYISRPLVIDQTVYAHPFSLDMLTGKPDGKISIKDRTSGACGIISGCPNMMLYRSGTLGYTDLHYNVGTESYGPVRPACWVNVLPVGGLVLMPDFTYPCTCSYLIKASVALQSGLRSPVITPAGGTFAKTITVTLSSPENTEAVIHYSLDGTLPTRSSPKYSGPVSVSQNTIVKARSFCNGLPPSRFSSADFIVTVKDQDTP
ncbi:MAG: PQQ-binding-like beta-propeller repeat protein [Sedimentisphaerales bacterium]|nr:PQQ-binding-like beta-propeller repeat protein [Sedimentisphaerales bacterium]